MKQAWRQMWFGGVIRWGPALALMGTIFWFSNQSQLFVFPESWLDLVAKKLAHATGYFLLALAYRWGLECQGPGGRRRALLAWGLAVLYALSDEWHQTFVPGRNGNLLDVAVDSLGATAALFAWPLLVTRLGLSPRRWGC